jgi:hypothetical protein
LVAVREDHHGHANVEFLVAGPNRLVELSSLYGHDAFLKAAALREVFAETL